MKSCQHFIDINNMRIYWTQIMNERIKLKDICLKLIKVYRKWNLYLHKNEEKFLAKEKLLAILIKKRNNSFLFFFLCGEISWEIKYPNVNRLWSQIIIDENTASMSNEIINAIRCCTLNKFAINS